MPYYQKNCGCCVIKVHPRDVQRFESRVSYRQKFAEVVYWSGRDAGSDSDEVDPENPEPTPTPSIAPAAIRAKANLPKEPVVVLLRPSFNGQ